jgi:molecular chaperone GrpE
MIMGSYGSDNKFLFSTENKKSNNTDKAAAGETKATSNTENTNGTKKAAAGEKETASKEGSSSDDDSKIETLSQEDIKSIQQLIAD